MPNYDPEPVFSSGATYDELSATGVQAAYATARANSYAAAHLEADAAELLAELDERRNEEAARDLTPEDFAAQLEEDAPGVLFSFEAIQHVASDALGIKVTSKFEGWCKFDGAPVRHMAAESWRELARAVITEYRARKGMGRAVPVVAAV